MSRGVVSLCLLLASPITAIGARVSSHKFNGGPHKCTIQWKWRRPGQDTDQVAHVSFGVQSCRIGCQLTNTDNHYNKVYARAFDVEDHGKYCECNEKDGGAHVIKFVGGCGQESEAQAKCFHDYKILATDELVPQWDKDTLQIEHHPELHAEREFKYDEIACVENACEADPECFESELPSIMAGRSDGEKKMIGHLMQKVMRGEISESQLGGDVQAMIGGLTEKDMEDIVFAELMPEEYQAGPLTVRVLKEAYEKKLQGTGLSVTHLLQVAGLTDLDAELTYAMFDRFLKPGPC